MATLASTVIDRVVQNFQMGDAQEIVSDGAGITTTDTQVTVSEDYRVGEGVILEMGTELALCTGWDGTNKIATIQRGWMGTTAASHALNSMIVVNPRVHRYTILDLINNCIVDMYPILFQVESQTITYLSATIGYALDADADKILSVMGRMDVNSGLWEPVNDWSKVTNQDVAVFSTGQAIMLRVSMPESAPVRVTYTKPFVEITAESDDLEAVAGLSDYMTKLPFYFAMSRVMATEEAERSQAHTAVNHQRAQDVPGFLALRTGEWYQARYKDLMNTCKARQAYETKKVMASGYGG